LYLKSQTIMNELLVLIKHCSILADMICNLASDCTHWTWVNEDNDDNGSRHTCMLKSSMVGVRYIPGFVSGTSGCQMQTTTWAPASTTIEGQCYPNIFWG
jgi:hypothetical protein